MANRTRTLPLRLNTAILAPYFEPGDATVIVKLVGVGSTAPFEMRAGGSAGRSFILEWNTRLDGHVVRIPLSLWMAHEARMAHELMDHRRMAHAMVVTFEMPSPARVDVSVASRANAPANANAHAPAASETVGCGGTWACGRAAGSVSGPVCPLISSLSRPAQKMGAAEHSVDASIVVVRGNDPLPAAPTVGADHSPCPFPAPKTEVVAVATADDAAVPMLGGRPVHEAAHEQLARPQRVKALAALLKVSEATLRTAAAAEGASVEIAGPWVRRRALNNEQ